MLYLLVATLLVGTSATLPLDTAFDNLWQEFKVTFNRKYSAEEEIARRLLWEENTMKIILHNLEVNLGKHSYVMGFNQFTDMSHSEFLKMTRPGSYRGRSKPGSAFLPYSNVRLPDTVDWRKEGCVPPVVDQKMCCPVTAIVAVHNLEALHKRKTGNMVDLSLENLVDCAGNGSHGCEGGLPVDEYFEYVKENGGIDTASGYPGTGTCVGGQCRFDPGKVGATCSGYVDLPSGDEGALKKAVAEVGPIASCIDASNPSFQMYRSGVYDDPNCSSTLLDFCILIVGYGTENGEEYWLVQNSWGTLWGEEGYIKMSRNKNNQCGIATMASYPLM